MSLDEREDIAFVPTFDPVQTPLPIPAGAFDAPPTVGVILSTDWVTRMFGALERLDQDDAWQGDQAARDAARQNVREILNVLAVGSEGIMFAVRQSPTNPCHLESSSDGGETWVPWADLSLCAASVPLDVPMTPGRYRVSGGVPQWTPDGGTTWIDLIGEASGTPIVDPPDPTEGDDDDARRCLAATRAALVIDQFYQATFAAVAADIFNAWDDASIWLRDVYLTIFSGRWPIFDFLLFVNNWLGFDYATHWTASGLTADQIEDLTQLLYTQADIDENDIVTFDFQAVSDNIIGTLGVNPGTAVLLLLAFMAGPGLNKAGSVAITDELADCVPPPPCAPTNITYSFTGSGHPNVEILSSVYYTLQNGFWVMVWDGAGDKIRIHVDNNVPNGECETFGYWVRYADVGNQSFRLTWLDTGFTQDFTYPSSTGWKYVALPGWPSCRGDFTVEKLGSGTITWQHMSVYGPCT